MLRAGGVIAVLLAAGASAPAPPAEGARPQQAPRDPVRLADLPPELPEGGRAARIALLPPENLTGVAMEPPDLSELSTRLETALARAGLEVVSGAVVDRFLARRRIRTSGGLDREAAVAARDELDVRGVLVTSVVQRDKGDPPRVALILRLESTEDDPTLYWIDGASRSGDESPGLLQLGLVHDLEPLERAALDELARSLVEFLDGEGPTSRGCAGGRRYRPRIAYGNLAPPGDRAATVAVLPFLNWSGRADAGEVAALELLRELAVSGRFRILEPAVVHAELLRRRIVIPGGVTLDTARFLLGGLEVDYVVAGTVDTYGEARWGEAAPVVGFTVTMLEASTGRIAWQSSSRGRGSDGVLLFRWGFVRTASELTCRLMREVSDGISGKGRRPSRGTDIGARPPNPRAINAPQPQTGPMQ